MLMRGDPGAGGLRGALVAVAVIAVAIAGSWLIPGFAWRGLAAIERPAAGPASIQADTTAHRDSVVAAPPTVPGAALEAPEPAASAPLSLASRLSGLVGLALILAIGI